MVLVLLALRMLMAKPGKRANLRLTPYRTDKSLIAVGRANAWDDQVLAVTLRQHRRCANVSSHFRATPDNVRVPSSAQREFASACDPDLNHAHHPLIFDAAGRYSMPSQPKREGANRHAS